MKKHPEVRILLTEGASLSARHTLTALGPHYTIDILDPDPLCQCRFSRYVRHWIRSPSFARRPAEFLEFLADQIRRHAYTVVLPTHEQVYLLSRFRDAIAARTGLALPEFSSLEKLQNKAAFARLLQELELPQPEVTIVESAAQLQQDWHYPFFLKFAHSTAGSGVFPIADRAQLDATLEELQNTGRLEGVSEILVQQPALGEQATVQAIFDRGRLVGVHCFGARAVGVGGMSTARTSAHHPVVVDQIKLMGKHLAWHGAMFVDYFFDEQTGRPEYIEANPRIGETVNALVSGVNLPDQLVRVSCGDEVHPLPIGIAGKRSHSGYMLLMSAAYDGKGRLRIAKLLWQWLSGAGIFRNAQDELTRLRDDGLSILPFAFITLQLLIWPKLARRIVNKTVENYSLPESATRAIQALPLDLLATPVEAPPQPPPPQAG